MGDVHELRLVSDLGQEDTGDDVGTSAVVGMSIGVSLSKKIIIRIIRIISRFLSHIEIYAASKEFEGQILCPSRAFFFFFFLRVSCLARFRVNVYIATRYFTRKSR